MGSAWGTMWFAAIAREVRTANGCPTEASGHAGGVCSYGVAPSRLRPIQWMSPPQTRRAVQPGGISMTS